MIRLPYGPHHVKSLEYKFSTPPVNVMVYGAEYDMLRQLRSAGRERLHETIATGWHITGWSLGITRDLSRRVRVTRRVERARRL
jgi:hypothetical protein